MSKPRNGRNRAVCMSCGKKTRRPRECRIPPEVFRCRACQEKAAVAWRGPHA